MIATAQRKFLGAKIKSLEKQRKKAVRDKVQPTGETDMGEKTMKIHRDLDKTQEQLKTRFYVFKKEK